MTTKQRTATVIGAVVGLVLGFVLLGDGRSVLGTSSLAVLLAIVAGAIGFLSAREPRRRQ